MKGCVKPLIDRFNILSSSVYCFVCLGGFFLEGGDDLKFCHISHLL